MSFGSAIRFDVKDGGKGGIFWQKEKTKQKSRKFGYKSKELRHPIRKPEQEYIEEPKEKPVPSKDFIRRNRDQFRRPRPDEDKENQRSGSTRPSSSIKPGTVTLTQDQLNALLATVGKLKPGEGSNIRISIDAENNALNLESPRNNMESAPNSSRSEAGDKNVAGKEISLHDLAAHPTASDQGNSGSSGYGSEEKSSGGKEVRFDTARNQERQKTPEAAPATLPPPVPWRHMTVAERKRLQWAREKEAEEELQRQRNYGPWGRPGADAPQKQPEPDPKTESLSAPAETHEEKLRKAIEAIEAKYGDLLNPENESESQSKHSRGKSEKNKGDGGGDRVANLIPGLDASYAVAVDRKEDGRSQTNTQLEDRGNTRPRRPDRRDPREDRRDPQDRKSREERRKQTRKPGRGAPAEDREEGGWRGGGVKKEEVPREGQRKEEEGGGSRTASTEVSSAAPAAMQTSLFIGHSEPDTTRFLSKKEEEKKKWLEELDRQREEKRLQKQREKEKQREGVDDTWADRFVAPSSRPPVQPHTQQQPQPPPSSYTTAPNAWERSAPQSQSASAEPATLPPAAMRSAMTIGNIAPNLDKIQQRQAEEKRLWLEELNKQREEQREARMRLKDKQRASEETWANRFTTDPRTVAPETHQQHAPASFEPPGSQYKESVSGRVGSAPQPAVNESLDEEAKTFLRGQNVHMDPVTRKELEEKRRKHLEYQEAIKAQMEEKERQKREERERKWREEIEGERKLQAERDALQRQLETENSKNRQREEARQRQVEHLKSLMDAEQVRAQEQRMRKRLTTLQQAGHDVSGLRAHYEALTPRLHQTSLDPATIPGLMPSPRESQGAGNSPRPVPTTYRASDGPPSLLASQELYEQSVAHDPYTENRVLTPSRFRQPSQPRTFPTSPQREFATQTDEQLTLSNGLVKEMSEVEIEFKGLPSNTTTATAATAKDDKNVRTRSAERKKPAQNVRGKPPPSNQNRQKPQKPQKGKPATWNYQNPKQKAAVKQSEKDLFYEQKRQESEERRVKRERQLQYLVELNKQVIPTERQARPDPTAGHDHLHADSDVVNGEHRQGRSQQGHRSLANGDVSHRSRSPPVNRNGKYRPANRSLSPPVPAVKRKTGHNAARDFERDFDAEAHNYYRPNHSFSPTMDERGNVQALTKHTDFIPFTRTNDVLDPSRADDPVQLSRENTRIKLARQNYHENLKPAEYGNQLDMYSDQQRQPAARVKDPILNPGMVKDHPTARQDQILQQLSSLKQSLIQRRREIETCMSPSDLDK